MKKKMFFSIAAATLLMANPVVNKADAAYNNNSFSTNGKVYVYQSSNMNQAEMNSIIQKYVNRLNMNWNQVEMKQPTSKMQDKTEQNTTQKPVQKQVQTKSQQPAQNNPVTQTPVQKTPA
jgi:predicted oxidoreductase